MGIRVTVEGDQAIARRFANTSRRRQLIHQEMEAEVNLIHAAVVPLTPVGVTAQLRNSWNTEVNYAGAGIEGIVGSPLIYAEVIERGRTPGAAPPPSAAIASWVAMKLGPDVSAFVVARSIGAKGIKERRMLQKAVAATLAVREALRGALMRRLIASS